MSFVRVMTFVFLSVSSFLFAERPDVLKEQSFELLTGSYNERDDKKRRFSESDLLNLKMYSENYTNTIGRMQLAEDMDFRIPQIIHFIWIGPRPFPEESIVNVQSWKDLHPEWRILFWTDSLERDCPIPEMEKHHIDELSYLALKPYLAKTTNYAEKADLIRYELLYEWGGVYVDHDVHCLRSFEICNRAFDFYAAIENPHTNTGCKATIYPCNCLIGARPAHPIIKNTIDHVLLRWDEIGNKYPDNDPKSNFARVINRTFRAFALGVEGALSVDGNIDMIFPSSYFFADKIFKRATREQLFEQGLIFAVHAFAGTWCGKKDTSSTSHTN